MDKTQELAEKIEKTLTDKGLIGTQLEVTQQANGTLTAEVPPIVEAGVAFGNVEGIKTATFNLDPVHPVSDITTAYARQFAETIRDLIKGQQQIDGNGFAVLTCRGYCKEAEAKEFVASLDNEGSTKLLVSWIVKDMENQVLVNRNQDSFSAVAKALWKLPRPEGRKLFKALRMMLVNFGKWPEEVGGTLQQQAANLSDERADRRQNPEKGQAEKQLKRDSAANQHGSWVQIARRLARDLAKNGPISVDDVTEAMSRTHKVAPNEGGKAHTWKGSIFTTSEWVSVGTIASRLPEAHGRPVTLWALKTWLNDNTLNGRGDVNSAFNLVKIYNDFKRAHPGMDLNRCNWYIGDEKLAADVRDTIVGGSNKLYGIPVCFMPGTVGAALLPPNYAQRTAPKAATQSAPNTNNP